MAVHLYRTSGIVAGLLTCLSLTSCSNDAAVEASTESAESAELDTASRNVAEFASLTPEFPMPTETFAPGSGTIAVVAGGFVAPIHAEQAGNAEKAAEALGWDVAGPYDGEFSPAKQGGYVDQAVQSGAEGIVLIAIDVTSISNSIDRALDNDVKVACVMCDSGDYREQGVMDVSVDFTTQGEYLGWYLIERSGGKAKVVSTVEPAAPQTVKRAAGLENVIEENCPGCSITSLTIPAADSTQPGPPQWTSFLSAQADGFTDAVAYYDGLSVPMLTTLQQTGRTDITVSGYDADPAVVEVLREGDAPFGATVGEPYEFATWGAVDLIARSTRGIDTWDGTNLPNVLVTEENAGDYTPYLAPQGDWQGEFKALWNG